MYTLNEMMVYICYEKVLDDYYMIMVIDNMENPYQNMHCHLHKILDLIPNYYYSYHNRLK